MLIRLDRLLAELDFTALAAGTGEVNIDSPGDEGYAELKARLKHPATYVHEKLM